ncbi:MAG: protoheme IX farnesyltransferase [Gammaproteobacteria bacterium RBG_16_57_12]|nr:MAG: protoheme IX farnesyltransferase [Gammaproteobacteria bacterium RBG_16_57_12]
MTTQVLQQQALRIRSALSDYTILAKPGIVSLTLVAALTGIYFGNRGIIPDLGMMLWTFILLGSATAGSCMLNNFYDRDIDRVMRRTSLRPLAAATVSARNVLIAGLILVLAPLPLMAWLVNPMTALLTAAAAFGYVVVYTMMTKRRTPWANQFGGIAGALPPVIGYAAVGGGLDANAWILFVIMAIWQQPHALSLALKYRDEYAKAGVPVVPVARGINATKQRIAIYNVLLLAVSVVPYTLGMAGMFYLATAIILGTVFLGLSLRFLASPRAHNMFLFFFSIIYLVVLFSTMVFDALP